MPVRFLITTLKPGVRPEDYEAWVRSYDYGIARGRENMISYEVYRIETPIEFSVPAPSIPACMIPGPAPVTIIHP